MHDSTAIGFLETTGYTPAMVALDTMEKCAGVHLVQAEVNDLLGIILKVAGSLADLTTALDSATQIAAQMRGEPRTQILAKPAQAANSVFFARPEFNPLIQQAVVHDPNHALSLSKATLDKPAQVQDRADNDETDLASLADKETEMSPAKRASSSPDSSAPLALGFIETQGFTAVFDAIDTACKAAQVEVIGKEKLGGGYVTVIVQGDVAAVSTAIESGKQRVEALGKLIAAHVIARPSDGVRSLLPQ